MILKKRTHFNKCDFYISLWVFYYLQDIVYPQGLISQIVLLFILLISFVYAFKVVNLHSLPQYLKGLNLLLGFFLIYGVHLIIFGGDIKYYGGREITSYAYLQSILISLLPIYVFYYFTKIKLLDDERLKCWVVVFFISTILLYFKEQRDSLAMIIEQGGTRTETTNNIGYYFVSLIPCMILFKKNLIAQTMGLLIIIFFLIFAMKRGALIIGVMCSLYLFIKMYKEIRGSRKLLIVILGVIAFSLLIFFFIQRLETSEYFLARLEDTKDGNSSGRDEIWSFFWNHFINQADFIHFIFGYGANGTARIFYNGAHNDWLEMATNNGLIGLILYFYYWLSFYKTNKKVSNQSARITLWLIFFIFLGRTFISQSYNAMNYPVTCMLGYFLANKNIKEIV